MNDKDGLLGAGREGEAEESGDEKKLFHGRGRVAVP
jgi:hypothetical protein